MSRKWVEESVAAHASASADEDYGYGWWIERESEVGGEYSAQGRGGQRIVVLPALNAVLVTTGGSFEPSDATDLLAPALVDPENPLPANPDGVARLQEALTLVRQAPAPRPIEALPATATTISGTTFAFGPNALEMATLRLSFPRPSEAEVLLTFHDGRRPPASSIGLDGVYRMGPALSENSFGLQAGFRGRWEDAHTFALEYDEIASRDAFLLTLRFGDGTITVEAKERSHQAPIRLEGRIVGN